MGKGHFITVEGIDSSGKSILVPRLAQWLREQGHSVTLTREPGGTPVGEMIRHIVLEVTDAPISPMTEMLLFAASRAQHVTEVIAPALEKGDIVLCDRYVDSSIAYQGAARGLGDDDVMAVNLLAVGGLMPELTLFLDIGLEEAARRQQNRPEKSDRLDQEVRDFHRGGQKAYYTLLNKYPERIVRIDGEQSPDAVFSACVEVVGRLLKSGN